MQNINLESFFLIIQVLYSQTYLNVAVNLLHSRSELIMTYSRASHIWVVWDQYYFFLFCDLFSAEQ